MYRASLKEEDELNIVKEEFLDFITLIERAFGYRKDYLSEKDLYENELDYKSAKKQISVMSSPLTFGVEINVLLVTDRLYGCSKGLKEYLQNSTDIAVDLVYTRDEAQKIIDQKPIDFLIIVGAMFGNKKNYAIIDDVKKMNRYASIIMYASLDCTIELECIEKRIANKHNRRYPIESLISYMRVLYDLENTRLHNNSAPGTSKAQLWAEALALKEKARLQAIEQARTDEKKQARKDLFKKISLAVLIASVIIMIIVGQYIKMRS